MTQTLLGVAAAVIGSLLAALAVIVAQLYRRVADLGKR